MDFELAEDQRAIVEAVETLLAQHAGPKRAMELFATGEYDAPLEAALGKAGFLDVALAAEAGPLEAALCVEAVARAAGAVAVGASALVGPCVTGRMLPGPIALVAADASPVVRFGAHARTLLVADPKAGLTRIVALSPGDAERVRSNFGYPMGRVARALEKPGERLAPGSHERLLAWWRVALATEAAGTMRAALALTIDYLKQRRQFGRAIASFQAVQHRLAECAVMVEGARWLAFEAAWRGAPFEAAATAAAYAAAAAARVFLETHQLSGAIGYTREHDLHVFSMRLEALRLELGGVEGHRRALAHARWGGAT
ncbi:MAG TPA: acyl-CoA dehydrogenase [Deltaproteobacteria bacterium]|nr:acyl-CoA dehydrogenase [Deltaproteobacteria bacterium]